MLFNCFLRKGIVYVPFVARTTAGYYMDEEPASVVPVSNTAELRKALHAAIAHGNPTIPTPTRANFPPPFMHKYAGVKDWSTFARNASPWNISERNGTYKIVGGKKYPRGGWVDDPEQTVTMPPGSTMDDVIDRLIAILQEKARATSRSKTPI